jgi:[acyl-carrier-protein] S-malonyltransferase
MTQKIDISYLFPGQGEQYPKMGKDFYDSFQIAKQTFEEAEDILSLKIEDIIFNSSLEELTKTLNCQTAIYITSIAIKRVIESEFKDLSCDVCAGLSLGEYSALHSAGYFSFADGLLLLQKRAQFLHETCLKTKGAMSAVIGLDCDLVKSTIDSLQKKGLLIWVANYNSKQQTVISGDKKDISKATEPLKEAGARKIIPLQVAGAFHSGIMKEAQDRLEPEIEKTNFCESSKQIVMNVVGDFVKDIKSIKDNLLNQVTGSVRWQQGIKAIDQRDCSLYIEIGPGKVLKNLNKRIGVKGKTVNVDKISDLDILAKELECMRL